MQEMISIIIPVHNAEETLDQCLFSVRGQTYANLEIIVIDDGSTDASLALIEKHAEEDKRIRVLCQTCRGAAAARNKGLDTMHGQYYGFVDADDRIEPEFYDKLHEAMIAQNADVVSSSIREIYRGDRIEVRQNPADLPTLSGIESLSLMLTYSGGVRVMVWDKLYRAELTGDIRFEEGYAYGEDAMYSFEALLRCAKLVRIHYVGYNYDHRASQVTGRGVFSHAKMSNVYVCEKMLDYVTSHGSAAELIGPTYRFAIAIYRQMFQALILRGDRKGKDRTDYLELKNAARALDQRIVRKALSIPNYAQWLMYLYAPWLFIVIHKLHHIH